MGFQVFRFLDRRIKLTLTQTNPNPNSQRGVIGYFKVKVLSSGEYFHLNLVFTTLNLNQDFMIYSGNILHIRWTTGQNICNSPLQ